MYCVPKLRKMQEAEQRLHAADDFAFTINRVHQLQHERRSPEPVAGGPITDLKSFEVVCTHPEDLGIIDGGSAHLTAQRSQMARRS